MGAGSCTCVGLGERPHPFHPQPSQMPECDSRLAPVVVGVEQRYKENTGFVLVDRSKIDKKTAHSLDN